jgi:DNA polymerase V
MSLIEFITHYNRGLRRPCLGSAAVLVRDQPRGQLKIALFSSPAVAGFPSPATDYVEDRLSTDSYLVRNPVATFFVKVKGDSMIDAGISNGDVLIVDRSIDAKVGHIVLAELDGEFTIKFLGNNQLIPANAKYAPIHFLEGQTVVIAGVVTGLMRKFI